ncbi:MAG TPA: chemotaxis protein CheD [Candidatus Polarisedimenticolia bacterium]|nr:chemotaxis protein CheD [Candidatus Polarisedimenticolia bacterium]
MTARPRSLRAGELRVTEAPGRLAIHGLGSCVAVFVYDPGRRVGGLAHILLPEPPADGTEHPGRYATTAVSIMVDESIRLGARRAALLAKVTGGSRMFSIDVTAGRPSVGDKNVEAALRALRLAGVAVIGSDVGGDCGRSVIADLEDGTLTIKTVRSAPRVL